MFGNNQIETLAKRVLRGEAEQSGRSSVPANDNAQAVCIDDRVSDLIDNPFCQLGLVFHGHAFRIRSHWFDCAARQDGSSTNGWLTSSSRPMSASRRLCRKTRPLKLREIADSFRPLGGRVELMMGERRTDQAAQYYEFSLERCSGYPLAEVHRPVCRFIGRPAALDA